MRRSLTILNLLLLILALYSCGKDPYPYNPAATDPSQSNDGAQVQLKEVVEEGSPAPLFQFRYHDSGYVTGISYASGFFNYELQYDQKKLLCMTNIPDGARLTYQYKNGLISAIRKTDAEGQIKWNYVFDYEEGRLSSLRWYRFEAPTDSVLERKALLGYGMDGNLSVYRDYWRTGDTELSLARTFLFKNYDSKINVDDFYLLKTFFEDVLFLPGVKMQKNNPGLVEIKGVQNDYEIKYSYTYQNKFPLSKKGLFRQTRGNGSGEVIELQTRFSYE